MRCLGFVALVLASATGGCLQFQQGPVELGDPKNYITLGDRERIFVEELGPRDAPALLLIHGYGATGRSWLFIKKALAKRYRVVIVDAPGFGRSDKYAGDYSLYAVAGKMFKLLDAKGIDKVHLVAHSWGTAVSLTMGLRHPQRIRSMTLISAFAYEEQLPPFLTWARAPGIGEFLYAVTWDQRIDDRLNYSFYDPDRFVYPAAVEEARKLMKLPGAMAASLAITRGIRLAPMEDKYRTMKQPVLIIMGEHDRVTRVAHARRLANDIPLGRLVVIPRCGHVPIVEAPAKVLMALLPFLAQQDAPKLCPCKAAAPTPSEPKPPDETDWPEEAPASKPSSPRPAAGDQPPPPSEEGGER